MESPPYRLEDVEGANETNPEIALAPVTNIQAVEQPLGGRTSPGPTSPRPPRPTSPSPSPTPPVAVPTPTAVKRKRKSEADRLQNHNLREDRIEGKRRK